MEIGSIFVLLAILLLAALFVARPFLQGRILKAVSTEEREFSSLLAERDRLITALQELDFDHVLHKIPAEDYPAMRADLLQKASEVLRALDSLQAQSVVTDAESRIEAAIAARRADSAQSAAPSMSSAQRLETDDDEAIESLVAARKAARREKSGGFCAKCGKPVLRSDLFCPHCGKPLR